MVKSKKILSLALAFVMALSVLTMGVFAAKTTPTATFTVSASASEVATGDEVTITVKANATETFYAGPMSLPIEYDASLFEYVADSATVANIYGESTTTPAVKAEAGKLTVALTPSTSGAVTAPDLNGANLTVLTFKLKAIGSTGSSTVAIADDQKTLANIDGKFYCGSFDSADPKTAELTELGQTLNRESATISFKGGSVGTPELVLTAAGEKAGTVISTNHCTADGFDGCVMGIDTLGVYQEETISDNVTVKNGTMVVNTDASNGSETTGTVIEVYNNNGDLVAKYVFIYFGDINGDGSINGMDAAYCSDYELTYEGLDKEFMLCAADINADETINGMDMSIIVDYELSYDPEGCFFNTQASIAANYA